jgi:hypothetical protein
MNEIAQTSTKSATTKRPARIVAIVAISCGVALTLATGHGNAEEGDGADRFQIDANSLRCIRKMTRVRQFYVDNLRGNLNATLAVANSKKGGVYPPGSVIQLVPGEAMVKRDPGSSPATHDWEFFKLDVSKGGTQIGQRGFTDVINRFGGNCFECHKAARSEWDLVGETDHGCRSIPVTRAMVGALQRTDPRCENGPLSAEDAEALEQVKRLATPPR